MRILNKTETALVLSFIAVGILAGLFFRTVAEDYTLAVRKTEKEKEYYDRTFGTLSLIAKSAYAYDITKGKELFSVSGDSIRPLASITKVMTAYTYLDIFGEDSRITVASEALKSFGDSGLIAGEVWRARDLAAYMLVTSSNDAAVAFEEESRKRGVDLIMEMNKKARRLGLLDTFFMSTTGLDDNSDFPTVLSNASDAAALLGNAYKAHPRIYEETDQEEKRYYSLDGNLHVAKNTNEVVSKINTLVASKTGYTESAGGNLAILFHAPNGDLISGVVLGSTQEERFSDMLELIQATRSYLTEERNYVN